MGVSLGKGKSGSAGKRAPIDNFRRAAQVVTVMRKTSRDASARVSLSDSGIQPPRPRPAVDPVVEENGHPYSKRDSLALLDDLRDTSPKKDTSFKAVDDSRTLVFKDTSDAWAALREGVIAETTVLPDTEFTLVESAISGYKTVERVRDPHDTDSEDLKGEGRARAQSDESELSIPYTLPEGSGSQTLCDEMCAICRSHSGGVLFPCRVCNHVFHEGCLQKSGRAQDATSRQLLYRATSSVGWSCHDCEDLSKLLHQDDMLELMEVFETADIDSDATISLEEFMAFRRRVFRDRHDRDMLPHEEEDEVNQFKAIDTDRTGSLSWWEFLSHEAVSRLSSLSKKSLAKKLSKKEVQTARENFRAFDTDGDGVITEYEARRAYRSWYSHFIPDPNEMTLRESDEETNQEETERRKIPEDVWKARSKELNTHVDANTELLMSGDADGSGTISWEEYLLEQALFIIAARPNVGPVKLNRRPSFAQ